MVVVLVIAICSQSILLIVVRIPRNPGDSSDVFKVVAPAASLLLQ